MGELLIPFMAHSKTDDTAVTREQLSSEHSAEAIFSPVIDFLLLGLFTLTSLLTLVVVL